MRLRKPSPALVVSVGALVVACSGTAVAVTLITSDQIVDGTIQNIDIKDGTIGALKLKKAAQTALSRPPVTITERTRESGPDNQPANTLLTVASVTVPAGSYGLTADTTITASVPAPNPLGGPTGGLSGNAVCSLNFGGGTTSATQPIAAAGRSTPATLNLQMTRTVPAPTEITLKCSSPTMWRSTDTSIIATRVNAVVSSEQAP
ncbi:MAG: hypothetical protein QOF76_5063 [Solirubrobacteraceae bacterium]|jgi:hypothetical protein|nr:hypothetical protein [Solirubrobacteraceae bacterium]